jgi:hypothetical protein
MWRLTTFPVLFLLALGCVIGASVATPGGECGPKQFTAASLVLMALGGALAVGSVVLPWVRYVRADGGRVSALSLTVSLASGLVLAGVLVVIPAIVILNVGASCD